MWNRLSSFTSSFGEAVLNPDAESPVLEAFVAEAAVRVK